MKLVVAPDVVDVEELIMSTPYIPVFLGGSIEQGTAADWQQDMICALSNTGALIFNPRRRVWDATWVQDETNPEFVEQVNWELDRIDESMIIFMYFQAGTKSPISLLELGMVVMQSVLSEDNMTIVVVCEPGFWRAGNVKIFCERHGVHVLGTLEEGIQAVKEDVEFWSNA